MRQRSKSRINPRLRPQRKQRLVALVENLGFFFDLAITEVFATLNEICPFEQFQELNIGIIRTQDFLSQTKRHRESITAPLPTI